MAARTVSAWEARRNFGKLMDEVAQGHRPVVVESHGVRKVAVVPVEVVDGIEAAREALAKTLEATRARAKLTEHEADALAADAVAWARNQSVDS